MMTCNDLIMAVVYFAALFVIQHETRRVKRIKEEQRRERIHGGPNRLTNVAAASQKHDSDDDNTSTLLIPSRRIVQLFPQVSHEEACVLLQNVGVKEPTTPVDTTESSFDETTRFAIQSVVDNLVKEYYPDDYCMVEKAPPEEVECVICLIEHPIQDFLSCRDGGHIFCHDCLRHYATEMLFGSGSLGVHRETKQAITCELICMNETCSSGFTQSNLSKVLTEKELDRYGELQGTLSIAKADVEDLCTCPKCGFKAELSCTDRVFRCPVDTCEYESCRDCCEASHPNMTCAQAKQSRKEKRLHQMEEDLTAVLLRTCPNPHCQKPMLKDGGCNKLTCPTCGWILCNVCKQKIDGYNHFCQKFDCQHKNCGKCSLWSCTTAQDNRAMKRIQRDARNDLRQMDGSDKGTDGANNKARTRHFVMGPFSRLFGLHNRKQRQVEV